VSMILQFNQSFNIVAAFYFRFDVSCTKSDMTITCNQHLMILVARGVASLPLYGIPFSCEGLSFDYNWDSGITFRVKVVEDGYEFYQTFSSSDVHLSHGHFRL
jgi:hypothetical protein